MSQSSQTETDLIDDAQFLALYMRDADGFYVRKENPHSETLNDERISANVRELLKLHRDD